MMERQALMRYIDERRDEAVEFLRALVAFDSTFIDQGKSGNEGGIQRWLAKTLEEWKFETRLFEPDNAKIASWPDYNPGHDYANRPNLVAIARGTGGGRSLLFNGHVDTVPLDDLSKWKHGPLSGEVEEGRLYGRGACDMKAGVAAMLLAARYARAVYPDLRGDVLLESVVDEEGGGNGTLSCIEQGYTADAAIVTEPTDLQIFCASRGVYLLEIAVEGLSIHACFKWKGVNAVEKAMTIANGLLELETEWQVRRKHPLLPSPTITLGQIEGGIGAAVVPGSCVMRYDIKYLPTETGEGGRQIPVNGEDVKREVEERIARICRDDPWLSQHPPRLNWYLGVMPHAIEPHCPLIDVISDACESVMGQKQISGMPSGADARHLQNNGKIQTIIFGPGRLENAHTIDECVDLESYFTSIKVLAETIVRWCE
jgi:acetylornithine deacetylase